MALRVVGAIPLMIRASLLLNGITLLFQQVGPYAFQGEGMNRILISITFQRISVVLLLLCTTLLIKILEEKAQ